MRITFARNDAFTLGNARSLWAARDAIFEGAGFVLAMADHVVEPAIVRAVASPRHVASPPAARCRLAVDRCGPDDPRAADATHVRIRDGMVVEIGKRLERWDALDTGVFWCTPRIFDLMTPERRDGELAAVFAAAAETGGLEAVDVTGMRWCDIDTLEDLNGAESGWRRRFGGAPL
jgi:choline kinase